MIKRVAILYNKKKKRVDYSIKPQTPFLILKNIDFAVVWLGAIMADSWGSRFNSIKTSSE